MKTVIVSACLLVAGCTGSIGIKDMTPEQIKAMVSDKSCTAVCSNVQSGLVTSKFVFLSCDKATIINGSTTVDANCVAGFNTSVGVKPGGTVTVEVPVVINPVVTTK